MRNIYDGVLKLYILSIFSFILFPLMLQAGGQASLDLNVTLNIQESKVEIGQPFTNAITISNLNTGATVDAESASPKITYSKPSGSAYNSNTNGSGWDCTDYTSTVECSYGNSLTNGQTSNVLNLIINAPSSSPTTLNPDVNVTISNATDPDTSNNQDSDSIDTGKSNLHATKTASKTPLELNEQFDYTIDVSNPTKSGNTTVKARNVTLSDTLPSEISYVSLSAPSGWNCSESSGKISCSGLDLDVDDTKTLTITVKATSGGTDIVNTASIATDSEDYNSNPSPSATVDVNLADVVVSQTLIGGLDSSNAAVGSSVTYRIHVSNSGTSPADNVTFGDTLPAGVTFVSSSGGWSCTDNSPDINCTLDDTSLSNSESYDLDLNVKMPDTHGDITNKITAYTTSAESDTNNDSSMLTHVKGADLNIDKTPDGESTDIGTNYTYTITVTNNGEADAQNVKVTDTLDSKMTYVSDSLSCGSALDNCDLGTITAGNDKSFTVTVTMPSDYLGDVTNQADVNTTTDQENNTNTSTTATTHITGPNLNISKDANVSDVGLGKTFSYTLTVSNVNSADATSADIEDQLPSGVKILSVLSNPDEWTCPDSVSAGNTFHCTKDTVSGNSSSTIIFEAQAPDDSTGAKQNTATISHSLNSNDGSSSATVNVTGVTLDIAKTASSTAVAGGLIDYSIKITNTSHSDADDLTLTDDLSSLGSGYTINSVTDSDGWNCSGTTTLTCTRSSLLAEGDNSTITFKVNVPSDASLGTVTNSASVTTTTTPSPTETDLADTTIEGADIVVVPPTTTTAIANENVVFTVKVRNDGSAVAKDVNITNYFNTNNSADFTDILIDCDGGTNYTTGSPYKCELGDIAKNETKTITISATAPNYDSNFPENSKIANGSLAVTSTTQSDETNDNSDWQVEIHGADLVVYKTVDKSEVAVNGIVTYTINVKNQWEATATNIQIDDNTLGSDGDKFTFVSGTLNYDSDDWTCNLDTSTHFVCTYKHDLTQDQTTSDITIEAKAPNTLSAIDNSRNNQVDTSTDTAEQDISTTNSKVVPVTIRGADLSITKTVSPNPAKLNESVTYTITVTNNGLADANDTNVSDTLPNGFTNITTSDCNNDGSNVSGQSVACTLGNLAQNDSKSFTITTNAPNTNGDVDNTATTATSTPEKNTGNNSDTVTLQVKGADLNLDKWDSADPVATNSTYYYYIGIRNNGFSSAYGAEFNDTIPTSGYRFTYVGPLEEQNSDWECSIDSNVIHCNTTDSNFEMAPGYNSGAIVRFKVQAPSDPGTVYNTAVVDSNTSDAIPANNTETESTRVIDIDLQAKKEINDVNYGSHENYIAIGGDLEYKIYIRNAPISGITPPDITDANVTDILPDNITNISISSSSKFTCDTSPNRPLGLVFGGDTLFCAMNDGEALSVGDGWVLVATISSKAPDSAHFDTLNNDNWIINKYKSETSFGDQDLANNAPTTDDGYLHTNTLVRGANMSITKTVSNDPVGANKEFNYTLSVKNWPRNSTAQHDLPSTDATNIVVKDTLPNDVNYTSASGTDWSCSENSHIVTCNYSGDMSPANSPSDIIINVKAPNTDSQILTNEANVTNDTPELEALLPDNTDSINTTTQGTDISISKSGPATAGMGDQITYHVTVTNSSAEADAKDVYVIDTLPNGATFDGNISNSDWTSTTEANGSIKFTYSQDLLLSTSTDFTFSSTLPNHTGTVRNHVDAYTNTVETSTPNVADWDTDIQGANIVFKNNPSQNPNPVGAYGHHQYQITIRNQGYSPAKDINVTFNFDNAGSNPGWSDINASGTNWTCDAYDSANSKLVCHLLTLANSADSSVLTIDSIAPNFNGDITNSVTVAGKDDENTTTGQTKSIVTHITGSDIKITKYAKDPDPASDGNYHDDNITVGVGKSVDFKFSIKNDNLGLAKEITLTDTFPDGFSDFNITDQGDWSCSFTTNKLTCNRTELLPNTDAQDILVSAKTSGIIGTATNTADINTSTIEVDNTNNTDKVKINLEGATLNTDLNVSKTEVAMDEVFTYTLNITNTGRNDGIDINVTNNLPADLTYLDNNGSDSDWTCSESNNTIVCNQPLISAYNGSSILKFNVKAPQNKIGIYQNSVEIDSNSIENSINAYAPDVRVIGSDLVVDINATPMESLEDRNVTYVINVKDINISTAYDIHIGQTFNPHVSAIYIVDNGGADCNLTDSNNSVECTLASLEYNKDENITIVATMPSIDTNTTVSSNVTVSTTSEQEDTSNDAASIDVKVIPIKPIADYRFEECKWDGTSGEVKDSIGDFDGTAYNDAQTLNYLFAKDDNNFSTTWRVGVFDGDNDYIEVPNDSKLQIIHNQTICLWLKPSNFDSRKNPYEKAYGGEGTITQETSGRLTYYFGDGYGNHSPYQGFSSSTKLKQDYWNHACIVRDLKNMKLYWYINGVLTNTATSNFQNATASTNPIRIGKGYAGSYNGDIDEVEIYNIALDDKAVKDIYNFEKNHKNYDGTDRPETICGVDLKVIKTANPSYKVGAESSLDYTITIQNLSNEPVTKGYTLTDIFPDDVNYSNITHSSNLSCTNGNDNNFTCTYPNTLVMNKGDIETLTISATTANVDKVDVTNTATAIPVQPEDDLSNNTAHKINRIIGTDLKITKIATPRDPNHPKEVYYDIKVENISDYADAREITVTDHYDSRLKFVNSVPSCVNSITNHTFVCTFDNIAKHDSKDIYITMSVNQSEQNLINEANVTSATVDTDLNNNSDTISVDVDANTSGVDIIDPSFEDFRLDGSVNKYGNIATIGNTILVAQNYNGTEKLDEVNSTYANSKGNAYVNSSSAILNIIDSNSSNPDDNITIEYASLLWGGHIHGDDKNDTGYDIPFNSVKLITPDGVEHTVTANKNSPDDANRAGYYHFKKGDDNASNSGQVGNFRIFYGARADITSIIRDLNTSTLNGGEFTVADMIVTKGTDSFDWAPYTNIDSNGTVSTEWSAFRDYGYFGGWTIVVAYSINHRYHREVKFKNLSSFSGFKALIPTAPGDKPKLPIDVSGFITPLHGNIESSLFTFIQGGDKELALEGMTIEDKNSVKHSAKEDGNNTDNIFNDSITLKNINNADISRNPFELYNVGTDADQYNLDSFHNEDGSCAIEPCYLSNQQNQTTVEISVKESNTTNSQNIYESEQAFAQMLSMQTQIFTPDFIDSYKECFKLENPLSPQYSGWVPCDDPLPLLRRGDTVKYRLTVINTGDDYAKDVYILDHLPDEITYEQNSSIVTNLIPFEDLETNSPCSSPDYEYNETIREQCSEHLQDLIENNSTSPLTTIPPVNEGDTDNINHNYNDMVYSDTNNSLVYKFDPFPKNNIAWIEFNATINGSATLGKTFKNKMSITFTNPTLADYNLSGGTITQVSLPVESSPIHFNWDNIVIAARDIGRNSVGAKVVNAPFDLNITLTGISPADQSDANTSVYINSLRIIDQYNGTTADIYPSVVNSNVGIPLTSASYTWTTHGTTYANASKELGFDMNISIKSNDGNYTDWKMYPNDFNSSAPYAGDVFTTRPKNYNISLAGATAVSGAYTIVKAADTFTSSVNAIDYNGANSNDYNASLTKGAGGIKVGLDSTFSTNTACINQGDLNISALTFNNGQASTNTLKYKNVGVLKLVLKDSSWTAKDQPNDCKTAPGDNNSSDADRLISCSVDGNSTSIIFEPDHFTFTNNIVADHNGGSFTYMVPNPITDEMFGTLTTTIEARNSNGDITTFFSNTCFADNTNINLSYDMQGKDLNDINLSIANDSNLSAIQNTFPVNAAGNNLSTTGYSNNFANGSSTIKLRIAVDRNMTTPLQPALWNAKNLKGSIANYLGITNANVLAGTGTDINATTSPVHFLFGRVHAPDYRFSGNKGTAKIYYEVYCKDCNQTYRNNMNIFGKESVDYIDWYANTLHTNLNDGNVSVYKTLKDVKFGTSYSTALSTTSSNAVSNGIENINVVIDSNKLPYIDKIEMNATDWVTFSPKDFILEFQNDQKDWAGQGKLGHTIDTNVSKRSNRRLNW